MVLVVLLLRMKVALLELLRMGLSLRVKLA